MAKGKHSAALFEVIKNTKQPEGAAHSLRTPKWWFKGSQSAKPEPVPAPSFTAGEAAADPTLRVSAPAPKPAAPRASSLDAGRSSTVHLDFDKHRQEITLRLRYTTAIVTAFAVCVVVGIAYVVGRHMSRGPQTASASIQQPTQQVRPQQAIQANVTDVNRQRTIRLANPETPQPRHMVAQPSPTPTPRPANASLVPANAETRLPRTIGLNYAIIQTYPPEEMTAAEAARDFLTKNGIPCTIEKTDYARNNWVCLVGTAGFTKISSAEFKGYVDNIIRLGATFPSSKFDRFKPAAYKWKG
ncbi:MAG TPA: hypothetical protein VLJ39_00955 [Tepidisphaeraceae bacterium]|jgi:hypothetical protein|nr:hypothetical protein [Tepidisphaeraceae bacterium]